VNEFPEAADRAGFGAPIIFFQLLSPKLADQTLFAFLATSDSIPSMEQHCVRRLRGTWRMKFAAFFDMLKWNGARACFHGRIAQFDGSSYSL